MTTQLLVRLKKILSGCIAVIAVASLAFVAQISYASDPVRSDTNRILEDNSADSDAKARVGEVSFVLGKAYIETLQPSSRATPRYSRRLIERGSEIRVNDRIVTKSNGHVHIRFEDGHLLSVRPNSRLEILLYEFDSAHPELSLLKFYLEEGVLRSISGKAAKSAPQSYRLNTPIAAIGVRGTDFTASATASTTRALVYEGSIVMAPYSAECSADALGPCAVNAVELTGASMQILELDGTTTLPRLVPAPHVRDPGMMREEVQLAIANVDGRSAGKTESNEVYLEESSTLILATDAADAAAEEEASIIAAEETAAAVVAAEEAAALAAAEAAAIAAAEAAAIAAAEEAAAADFTPQTPVTVADTAERQLVWGRYFQQDNNLERITLSYAEASADRQTTVATSEYGLFRTEYGSKRVDKGLGIVSFSLSSAQAYYNSASGVVAMQVKGGNLGIDFQENTFATELNLDHSATGPIDFFADGRLFDGGYFHARTDTQRIAGAVSLDGTEAGYFFEQQLDNGNIQGLTLWNSQ